MSSFWIWAAALHLFAPWPASAQPTNYSIELQAGYNSIGNALVRGANQLDEIIPNAPEGSLLFKWNAARQEYYSHAQFFSGFGWFSEEPEMQVLNPGEGAFMYVPQDVRLTFSGNVAASNFPPRQQMVMGLNFVSPHRPRTMSFGDLFGFDPQPGDIVYLYERAFSADPRLIQEAASSIHTFTAARGWNVAPLFRPGRSAFVFLGEAPHILVQPRPQIVSAGQTLRLEVSVLGTGPLSYQWHLNEDDLLGETNASLLLANLHFLQSGLYSVSVKNPFGEATSRPASVQVRSPPVILEPPRNVRAIPGQHVMFAVKAVGTPTLRYRWFRDNQPLPNATGPILEFPAKESDSSRYHVRVTNELGFAESQPVSLEVNIPPRITRQPVSQIARLDGTVTFDVEATGTPPLTYHWRHNGQRILSSTNSMLVISNIQPKYAGDYDVVVANVGGTAHSEVAELILDNVDAPFIFLSDSFAESALYPMPVFTGRGDNRGASNEISEVHCKREGGSSVWLRWMTTERGIVRFETSGSSFDTVLAAYLMDTNGALIEVACDDDEGEFLGSRIHFAALPDAIYHIVIDGLDGARGEIMVDWKFEPTAEFLPRIIEQPRDQTARFDQPVVFSVVVAGNPDFFQWYRNGVELPGQNQPELRLPFITRNDVGYYYVEVHQGNQIVRSRRALLQVSLANMDSDLLQAFAVDKFADAVYRPPRSLRGGIRAVAATAFAPVLGYTGTQIFSTIGFGGEPGELSHCGFPGGSSAWFSYRAPTNGQLHLNTAGSSFDTILAVYTGPGPTIASLTPLICDNDSGPGATSSLNFPATQGTLYYIALDGFNGATGTAQLNYRLLIPITLSDMVKTNNGPCRFTVHATPSYPFTIQRCAGLSTWVNVLTSSDPDGAFNYTDNNTNAQKRFYRVLQTP